MVLIVPMYEEDQTGVYYNTAAVIDADGRYLGKYRKTHIPQVNGFWEKFYFKPGNLGYPVFATAVGQVGVYICYDRHFPEGPRLLGLHGAEMIFIPSATSRGLSMHLWEIEQRSAAIFNGLFVGTINRVGQEPEFGPNDYYGTTYFCDPRGQYLPDTQTGALKASDTQEQLMIADMNLDLVREVRNTWQFYRDRRPEMYGDLTNPAA
jgi:N-carbamoylputrescine amidase